LRVLQIPPGFYSIPSKDRAAAIEEIVFELSNSLIKNKCEVFIIDIPVNAGKREGLLATIKEIPDIFPNQTNLSSFNFNLKTISFAFFCIPKIIQIVKRKKIEIIHTHYSYSALTTLIIGKLFKIPVIHTTHAHDMIMTFTIKNRIKGFAEYIVLKNADHIIAPTPSVKKKLIQNFHINEKKITIIYSGTSIREYKNFSRNDTYKNKIPVLNHVILCVGRYSARKNQVVLLKSVPKILKTEKKIKFIFIGPINEPEYFKSMKKYVDDQNLLEWVDLIGESTKERLIECYKKATLFVFPTTAEIQGMVLIEAMSFGIPVIASKIEPIIDISDLEESCIFLVNQNDPDEIADAILSLMKNPELCNLMSQKGIDLSSRFSWDQIAKQTMNLYNEIINKFPE
jgi:glycosyltransferase involved in cell wall biosynthesis